MGFQARPRDHGRAWKPIPQKFDCCKWEPRVNPFRDTIVASPWEATRTDVPEIHGEVFDRCLEGIEHVRQSGRSAALLIHGEAGSGKTHLLSRLRTYLAPQGPTATNRRECLYVWVRLQTSP